MFLHHILIEPNLLPHSYQFTTFFTLSVFSLTVCWTTHTKAIYQAVTMRVLSRFVDSLALTAEHWLCALSPSKPHHCVQHDLLACSKDRHKSHYQIAQPFGPCFSAFYFAYKVANTSLKTCITWLWLAREMLAGRLSLGRLKSTD